MICIRTTHIAHIVQLWATIQKNTPVYYSYLAGAFNQSKLQLIRLNRGISPLQQCSIKGSKGPTAELILLQLHWWPNHRLPGSSQAPSPLGYMLPIREQVMTHRETLQTLQTPLSSQPNGPHRPGETVQTSTAQSRRSLTNL